MLRSKRWRPKRIHTKWSRKAIKGFKKSFFSNFKSLKQLDLRIAIFVGFKNKFWALKSAHLNGSRSRMEVHSTHCCSTGRPDSGLGEERRKK